MADEGSGMAIGVDFAAGPKRCPAQYKSLMLAKVHGSNKFPPSPRESANGRSLVSPLPGGPRERADAQPYRARGEGMRVGFSAQQLQMLLFSIALWHIVLHKNRQHNSPAHNQRPARQHRHSNLFIKENDRHNLRHHKEKSDVNPHQFPKIPFRQIDRKPINHQHDSAQNQPDRLAALKPPAQSSASPPTSKLAARIKIPSSRIAPILFSLVN